VPQHRYEQRATWAGCCTATRRLRWLDVGLPRPECQVEIPALNGGSYYLDIGLPERKLGAEVQRQRVPRPRAE
jgi:hypothetical protein